MQRISIPERANWRALAEAEGFVFHSICGDPYWDESAYYRFTLQQIERDLEAPAEELHQMCLALVDRAVADSELMEALRIPRFAWDFVASSWLDGERGLYGRFDFIYDGAGPAKLMEYNADTPTAVYETAWFQWGWLEDLCARGDLPAEADQFNSLHEKLVERFRALFHPGDFVHFASVRDMPEDQATVRYLQDCAVQAGLETGFVFVEEIGLDADGCFVDAADVIVQAAFKLFPWEEMLASDYAAALMGAPTRWLEPPWKAILANKAILPLLWRFFPGHPNLLPSYFEGDAGAADLQGSVVRKPIFGREGANITVYHRGAERFARGGDYGEEGFILQAYRPLPVTRGGHTMIGAWMVGDAAAGIGIREDATPVTSDDARFLPHIIL